MFIEINIEIKNIPYYQRDLKSYYHLFAFLDSILDETEGREISAMIEEKFFARERADQLFVPLETITHFNELLQELTSNLNLLEALMYSTLSGQQILNALSIGKEALIEKLMEQAGQMEKEVFEHSQIQTDKKASLDSKPPKRLKPLKLKSGSNTKRAFEPEAAKNFIHCNFIERKEPIGVCHEKEKRGVKINEAEKVSIDFIPENAEKRTLQNSAQRIQSKSCTDPMPALISDHSIADFNPTAATVQREKAVYSASDLQAAKQNLMQSHSAALSKPDFQRENHLNNQYANFSNRPDQKAFENQRSMNQEFSKPSGKKSAANLDDRASETSLKDFAGIPETSQPERKFPVQTPGKENPLETERVHPFNQFDWSQDSLTLNRKSQTGFSGDDQEMSLTPLQERSLHQMETNFHKHFQSHPEFIPEKKEMEEYLAFNQQLKPNPTFLNNAIASSAGRIFDGGKGEMSERESRQIPFSYANRKNRCYEDLKISDFVLQNTIISFLQMPLPAHWASFNPQDKRRFFEEVFIDPDYCQKMDCRLKTRVCIDELIVEALKRADLLYHPVLRKNIRAIMNSLDNWKYVPILPNSYPYSKGEGWIRIDLYDPELEKYYPKPGKFSRS